MAKWKRDAEAWYRQDTALFEDLFHMVEANVVRMWSQVLVLNPRILILFLPRRQGEMIIKVW